MQDRNLFSQMLRFAAVGGANTTVHYAVYLVLWPVVSYVLAHLVGTLVATVCSYVLNCRYTFSVMPRLRTFMWFPLSTVVAFVLSTAAMVVAVDGFDIDPRLAPLVGGAVAIPATFALTKVVLTGPLPGFAGTLRSPRQKRTPRTPNNDWLVAIGIAVFVAVLGVIPVLVNPSFYFWDDSAAQFLPMWHRIGERVLAGEWPPLLETAAWMGGNLAAESLFGVWNPVHLLDFLLVVWIGDLAVAATVVKIQFLVTLAVGVFLLCRDYGAARTAASAVAVAMPVSGFVLYFQASSWAGGLMGLAWLPWVWWSARRLADGRMFAGLAWAFCFLCVSAGDPYALLALCFVFVAVVIESWLRGAGAAARHRLMVLAVTTAMVVPLVFLPVLGAAAVSWRSGWELFNIGLLVPDLADLLTLSMPSYVPQILSFGSFRMTVPALYFAWFVTPLLAWLDWPSFTRVWKNCSAAMALAVVYVLLCLGPSNAWLFRWPLRHVPVLYLALSVLVAVALSRGLRTDRVRTRVLCTVGLVMLSSYLSVAAWPSQAPKHLVSFASVIALAALAIAVARSHTRFVAVLHLGTAGALALQMLWFPANRDVAAYHFPSDVEQLRSHFAKMRGGTVVQIANRVAIPPEQIASGRVWNHLLFGNMWAAVAVPSVVSYTGIGFEALHKRLCLSYYGSVCPQAYSRLWSPDETGTVLAEQLKAQYVVVQRSLIDDPAVPAGWHVSERNDHVTVLGRNSPPVWRQGTVSVARGVTVQSDVQRGSREENVRFAHGTQANAQLVFARLAWPGYQATVDGQRLAVEQTSAGLVSVRIPPHMTDGTLTITWSPPWFGVLIASACAGMLGSVLFSVLQSRKRGIGVGLS